MADATHYVETPPRRLPRRGGIRSVAEFRSADGRFGLGGIVEYTDPGCQMAVGEVALCYPGDTQDEKLREGIQTLTGIGPIFGVYAGVECWLEGDDFEARARVLLENGEDRGIEAALSTWIEAATAETFTGTTVSDAVAFLDNLADTEYVGLPTLVLNRGDAVTAFAENSIAGDRDGNLWTANGTPVLASSAVPVGSVSVVGGITVLSGEVTAHRAADYALNREFAIAERVHALIVDCGYRSRVEL